MGGVPYFKLPLNSNLAFLTAIEAQEDPAPLVAELTHTANVTTATWRPAGPVDVELVRTALARSGLLRAKGSITTTDGPMLVHLAGDRIVVEPRDEALDAIVLIGADEAPVDAVVQQLSV